MCEVCISHFLERHIRHVSILSFRKVMKIWNVERVITKAKIRNPKRIFQEDWKFMYEKMKFYQQKVRNVFSNVFGPMNDTTQ